MPENGNRAQYAQVWMYDGDEIIRAQQTNFDGLRRNILEILNNLMQLHNPYVTSFKMAYQRIAEDPTLSLHLRMVDSGAHDPRRYNRPTREEIAGIIVGDEFSERQAFRDLILEHHQQGYQRVSELHPSYFPLRYPFMFLRGEQGWHPQIPLSRVDIENNPNLLAQRQNHLAPDNDLINDNGNIEEAPQRGRGGSVRVSQAQFYNYHFQFRPQFSPLMHAGRLLQEMIIDAWVYSSRNDY